jgi:hypothetical protein
MFHFSATQQGALKILAAPLHGQQRVTLCPYTAEIFVNMRVTYGNPEKIK